MLSQEDSVICRLVNQHGLEDWTRIADKLKEGCLGVRRTGKQCRERWYNHLSPAVSKKPWSPEEESRLFEMHRSLGNRWKDISKHFLGRYSLVDAALTTISRTTSIRPCADLYGGSTKSSGKRIRPRKCGRSSPQCCRPSCTASTSSRDSRTTSTTV